MSTWTPPRHITRGASRKFRESTVSEYKGREQRLVRTTNPFGYVTYYAGGKGQERKVRQVSRCGSVTDYKGPKGKEYWVRWAPSAGRVYHYEGINGKNILARRELPDGTVEHFKRVKGQKFDTARSHTVLPDGSVKHFEGDKLWNERMVRHEVPSEATRAPKFFPYGAVMHYEGEQHHERLVCKEVRRDVGTARWYYEGPKDSEKVVHVEKPNGKISYYEDQGIHVEYTKWPNGKVARYAWGGQTGSSEYGPRSLWCVDHPDGRADYFNNHVDDDSDDEDGPWHVRDDCIAKERLSETTFPNGDRHYYCPYNDNRLVCIFRKATCRELPRSQVLWYRVREWFRKRTIVLHWQEQTQMRLAAPGGAGRLKDRAAFETDFCG